MSTSLSSVRIAPVSQLWPRVRRLLVLACLAAIAIALLTATAAPHALAAGVVHLQRWVAGLSQLDVFLALVGLAVGAIALAVATAIDDESREIFDVR